MIDSVEYQVIEMFCAELEVEPNLVREIRLEPPNKIRVTLFQTGTDGSKFIAEDGGVALSQRVIDVEIPRNGGGSS